MFQQNQASDENPKSLRVSIDTKAKVKIGNLSRGGKARSLEPKKADDHDTEWQALLVPFGILNTHSEQLSIYIPLLSLSGKAIFRSLISQSIQAILLEKLGSCICC